MRFYSHPFEPEYVSLATTRQSELAIQDWKPQAPLVASWAEKIGDEANKLLRIRIMGWIGHPDPPSC